MEEKDLIPPVPPAGMQLGVNFLEARGGLKEALKNRGDAVTSEETYQGNDQISTARRPQE